MTSNNRPAILSQRLAGFVKEQAERYHNERDDSTTGKPSTLPQGRVIKEGFLDEDLDPATVSGSDESITVTPTTAKLNLYHKDSSDSYVYSQRQLTVTNWDADFSAATDSHIVVVRTSGEWRPLKPGGAFILGKTDAAHNKSASGTVSIYTGTTKGSETDSTNNVTAYNRFANVESGKWVLLIYINGGYEMIAAEC